MGELISIIIPVYKVAKYLERCIQSVVNQDYENIEILLINDGSPDECPEICERWAEKDFRIRVINQKNRGLSAARNTGIQEAKGSWLMFVDSDDWVEPNFCSLPLFYAEKKNCDLVIFGIDKIYEDGSIEWCSTDLQEQILSKESAMMYLATTKENYAVNKFYKKNLFYNICFPEGRNWEDIATTYLLIEQAEKIYYFNVPLYHYFMRIGSITHKRQSIRDYSDMFQAVEAQYRFFEKKYPAASEAIVSCRMVCALLLCMHGALDKNEKYQKIVAQAEEILKQSDYQQLQMSPKHKLLIGSIRNMPPLFYVLSLIKYIIKGNRIWNH